MQRNALNWLGITIPGREPATFWQEQREIVIAFTTADNEIETLFRITSPTEAIVKAIAVFMVGLSYL